MTNTAERVKTIRPVPLPLSRAEEDYRVNEQSLLTAPPDAFALGNRVYERGAVSEGEGVVIALFDSRARVRWDNGSVQWIALDSLVRTERGEQ